MISYYWYNGIIKTKYYQRIAPFQAHHIGTRLSKAQEQLMNFFLHYINKPTNLGATNIRL